MSVKTTLAKPFCCISGLLKLYTTQGAESTSGWAGSDECIQTRFVLVLSPHLNIEVIFSKPRKLTNTVLRILLSLQCTFCIFYSNIITQLNTKRKRILYFLSIKSTIDWKNKLFCTLNNTLNALFKYLTYDWKQLRVRTKRYIS